MSIFEELHDRKNTRSVKWDMLKSVFQSEDVLPMWVADMDFKAPEAVNNALVKRARHGIYGYTVIDDDVTDSIMNWIEKRHNWTIDKEWLSFSPGVVTSLHLAIQAFTEPDDKIIIQTPVYTPFYNVIEQHDREVVKNPLVLENGSYTVDFSDFEEKLKQGVKAFLLCSPHNPTGRVWKREELEEIARLCCKYDVIILSDEIHADLIYPGEQHTPIASLSEEIADRTITCMAPSKTFNLAGLQASYVITTNKEKRARFNEHLSKQGHGMLNTMGNTALEAAYVHGEAWLDELMTVIKSNQEYVTEMLEKHTDLKVTRPEGTYLLWIDCSALNLEKSDLNKFMIEKAKVGLNAGASYGDDGANFMRMNIACPKSTVKEGVKRIIDALNAT
ncbi:pyridoxal phosphate-dependent aminotransferase [Virgibacillus sp. NKC19-3]|uniref:MalY/PatB family protein n=1 Tax=Virgibacillus saliphilus TaxID=2831674 RepID=UPI001C9AEC67|nr:MalY/PatB family protein [Virgibacillus sp. NKC19-3]MBY7143960.1 pyridoxal phosphate-dependent aminotransferase [Virgibacillus sp. NKC19-3]